MNGLEFWEGKEQDCFVSWLGRVWLWRAQLAGTGSSVNFLTLGFLLAWITFLFPIISTSVTCSGSCLHSTPGHALLPPLSAVEKPKPWRSWRPAGLCLSPFFPLSPHRHLKLFILEAVGQRERSNLELLTPNGLSLAQGSFL